MKHLYWLTIPLIILGYIFTPSLLESFERLPVPENQQIVEQELLKMYGDKLKVLTVENSQRLNAGLTAEESIYNYIPFEIPVDGTIVGYQFTTNAQHQVHHSNVYDQEFDHPFCDLSAKIIFAVGEEMSPTYYPKGYGYVAKKGKEFMSEVMWYNESSQAVNAKMKLKVFYVEDTLEPVIPTLIDVAKPCITTWVEIPENGKVLLNSFKDDTAVVAERDYRVLSFGPHCHEGCQYASFLINEKEVFRFTPEYDDHGHHPKKIAPIMATDLTIRKGDKVGLEVYYDNTGNKKQVDGMGNIFLILQAI